MNRDLPFLLRISKNPLRTARDITTGERRRRADRSLPPQADEREGTPEGAPDRPEPPSSFDRSAEPPHELVALGFRMAGGIARAAGMRG